MTEISERAVSQLTAVSNAMVKLHKEQFGRGPTNARCGFAGPDTLVCVLENAMLPAELKMVAMGDAQRVRETRIAFQAATTKEFVAAVEEIVQRDVRAFSSGIDVEHDVIFENFVFQPRDANGNGTPTPGRAGELGKQGETGF
jgi:uncharacterized protein YbcI